ncbi:MAG: SDR family NAD(P)-dependent oxidoreductase [Mucilaginibacter sp.]
MAKIFITGSADGLGLMAAKALIAQGHHVVLHGRNAARAEQALSQTTGAITALTADLSNIDEIKKLGEKVNKIGQFDTVIHNAGVYQVAANDILIVNTLAPYILTCVIQKPKRLIYLSSGMHLGGRPNLEGLKIGSSHISYSDSKLHVLMLCKAIARKWPQVYANSVDPGWVPTKMGGKGAPDDLQKGYETQVWLAASDDEKVKVSGRYFFHQKQSRYNMEADSVTLQERFLDLCQEITGVAFPL